MQEGESERERERGLQMNLDFNGGQICGAQYNPSTQKAEEGDLQIQD